MKNQAVRVCGIVIVLAYIAGVICLFSHLTGIGIALWVLSTIFGAGFLWYQDQKKRREELEKELARGDDKDPEGEDPKENA